MERAWKEKAAAAAGSQRDCCLERKSFTPTLMQSVIQSVASKRASGLIEYLKWQPCLAAVFLSFDKVPANFACRLLLIKLGRGGEPAGPSFDVPNRECTTDAWKKVTPSSRIRTSDLWMPVIISQLQSTALPTELSKAVGVWSARLA